MQARWTSVVIGWFGLTARTQDPAQCRAGCRHCSAKPTGAVRYRRLSQAARVASLSVASRSAHPELHDHLVVPAGFAVYGPAHQQRTSARAGGHAVPCLTGSIPVAA